MCDLVAELRNWQTVIGAVLGFLALVFAALYNFHLNRKHEKLKIEELRKSTLAAIYGEIISVSEELAVMAKVVSQHDVNGTDDNINDQFVRDYELPDCTVFSKLVDQLGILPNKFVIPIIEFYSNYNKAKSSLSLISSDRTLRYSTLAVLKPSVSAIKGISSTLREIENLLEIEIVDEPDLGNSETIIHIREMDYE